MATNSSNSSQEYATDDQTPPRPRAEFESGVSRNMPFATPFKDAWEILRTDEITIEKLIAMRNTDGQARALFGLITLPIRAALKGATFLPVKNADGGEEEAKFVEDMFMLPSSAGGMEVPFAMFMAQMLLAIFDGFSAFEMVYNKPPKSGPLKGKITLKKFAYRAPDTLTFLVDEHGNYNGLRQRANALGKTTDVVLPKEHTIYYAANEAENPYYGKSFFTAAFYHWDKKVKMEYIMHLAGQRAAVGTRVGKAPLTASAPEKVDFKKALANLTVAQHILVPVGFEVDSLHEAGQWDFLGVINYHNSQMSKSVLAPFFDQNQGAGNNDGPLVDFGKQSDALFLLMLQTIMGDIAEIINQKVIPRFIDWNYGTGKYPTFRWGELTPAQIESIKETFDKTMTGKTTPEFDLALEEKYAVDILGLELNYDEIKEEALEQKKQDKMMQDAQMQQGMMGAALGGDPTTSMTLDEAQATGATNLPGGGAAPPPVPGAAALGTGLDSTLAPPPSDGNAPAAKAPPASGDGTEEKVTPSTSTISLGSIPQQYLPDGFVTAGEG